MKKILNNNYITYILSRCTYSIMFILLFNYITAQSLYKNRISTFIELNTSSPNSIISSHNEDYYVNQKAVTTYRASYGASLAYGLSLERNIHQFIFLYLNSSYHDGFKSHINYIKTDSTEYNSYLKTTQFLLNPGIIFEIPIKKFNFQMQCGIILPLKVNSVINSEDVFYSNVSKMKWEYSYNFSAGYQAGIGFNMNLFKNFNFAFLLNAKLLSLTLKEANLSSYQVNNIDLLNELNIYDKKIIYLEDLNNFSNNDELNISYDKGKEKNELTKSHSFSTLGMKLSFIYSF